MSRHEGLEPTQDPFLNKLRKRKTPVTIFLTNGARLDGVINSFDAHTVLLTGGELQIVYKHTISTIAAHARKGSRPDSDKGERGERGERSKAEFEPRHDSPPPRRDRDDLPPPRRDRDVETPKHQPTVVIRQRRRGIRTDPTNTDTETLP
jgi:host factor-I protein